MHLCCLLGSSFFFLQTGVTSLTADQQLALRLCDAARERHDPNADACKRLDETPGLAKQWGIRLCDTNSGVPCL